MRDELYERAEALIDDDNFAEAIPLLKKSLDKGNYDSAFALATIYLDCYEELNLSEADYDNAIKLLQKGALNNHKDCQKELGLIYATEKKYNDPIKAINWLFKSNDCESEKDINLILKLIDLIYKTTSSSSIEIMKGTILKFKSFINMTNNNKILKSLYRARNDLIKNTCELIISNSKNIDELENEINDFKEDFNRDFMIEIKKRFAIAKLQLFMKTCNSVQDALEFLDDNLISYDKENLEPLYLFIARSYKNGENGAPVNYDEAIKYYDKVNTQVAISEKDEIFYRMCSQFITNKEYEKAKKYLSKIQSYKLNSIIKGKIEAHEKILYFEYINKEAESGDYSANLKLAKLYEKGDGVTTNYNKAKMIYEELFNTSHTQETFDTLYDYYEREENSDSKIKELLKTASTYKLQFDYNQKNKYKELVIPYATSYYKEVHTKGLNSVDTEGNIIYYMFDYYKKWWLDNYPNNQFYRDNFFTFMSIKKRDYNQYSRPINFPAALYKFFELISGSWIICTTPGHEKTINNSNGVSDIINMVYLKSNFILRNTLIQRTFTIDKKATSNSGRNTNYQIDMQSLAVEPGFSLAGKNIIVVDDITTSGSTLIACKNILMNAGANKVVLLALGKTKEPTYGI